MVEIALPTQAPPQVEVLHDGYENLHTKAASEVVSIGGQAALGQTVSYGATHPFQTVRSVKGAVLHPVQTAASAKNTITQVVTHPVASAKDAGRGFSRIFWGAKSTPTAAIQAAEGTVPGLVQNLGGKVISTATTGAGAEALVEIGGKAVPVVSTSLRVGEEATKVAGLAGKTALGKACSFLPLVGIAFDGKTLYDELSAVSDYCTKAGLSNSLLGKVGLVITNGDVRGEVFKCVSKFYLSFALNVVCMACDLTGVGAPLGVAGQIIVGLAIQAAYTAKDIASPNVILVINELQSQLENGGAVATSRISLALQKLAENNGNSALARELETMNKLGDPAHNIAMEAIANEMAKNKNAASTLHVLIKSGAINEVLTRSKELAANGKVAGTGEPPLQSLNKEETKAITAPVQPEQKSMGTGTKVAIGAAATAAVALLAHKSGKFPKFSEFVTKGADKVRTTASGIGHKTSEVATKVKEHASEAAGKVSDKAHDFAGKVSTRAGEIKTTVTEKTKPLVTEAQTRVSNAGKSLAGVSAPRSSSFSMSNTSVTQGVPSTISTTVGTQARSAVASSLSNVGAATHATEIIKPVAIPDLIDHTGGPAH